jgi:DNA replication protein
MKELEFLYDRGYMDVPKMIQTFYLRIGLNEAQAMVLMRLYEQELAKEPFLAIQPLAANTSMDANQVAELVHQLVEQEFISMTAYEDDGQIEEVFTVYPTVVKIFNVAKDSTSKLKQESMKLLESELKRPLSSKEMQIIDGWNYDFYMIKAAVLAAIKQQKVGVEYVNKILENQAKEPKDMSYFQQLIDE